MSAWKNQPRQPKGRPVGGEWTEKEHANAAVSLADRVAPLGEDLFTARREQFIGRGYVPGVATQAVISPETTAKRADWWDTQFVQAEYDVSGGYMKMPDDYTPARKLGHAMSGHRRTHRMKYRAGGVTLRMPSKTAINRFSDEHGGNTFDVPVSASVPGGDVQGWVRVTKVGRNEWETTGVGFPPEVEVGVAESVAATLEGRAAAMKAKDYGDLIERRKQRLARQGSELQDVQSSWIGKVGYDRSAGVMATVTANGKLYGHKVPENVFSMVSKNYRPGAAFNKFVKGTERAEVTRCDDCGRFMAAGGDHKCPRGHRAPLAAPDSFTRAAHGRASSLLTGTKTDAGRPPAPTPPTPGGHTLAADDQNIDLRAALLRGKKHVEPGEKGIYGKRGWTADVAPGALGEFTSSTYNRHMYREDFDGKPVKNGDYGLTYYSGAGSQAAKEIVAGAPAEALTQERQNDAPTLGTIIKSAASHPGKVEFGGYIVGPDRSDERISADTVFIFDDEADANALLLKARDHYGLTDAKRAPDELQLVEVPWRPGEKAWRLWWD